MSHPVIGPVGARQDGLDAVFWDGLASGRLLLQFCGACETWIWSPQWICPACRRPDPGWKETAMRGHVYSWTRTHQPFAVEFAQHLPYVTVLVELADAGGRRLLGLLTGAEAVRIGDSVEGYVEDADGVAVLRWRKSGAP